MKMEEYFKRNLKSTHKEFNIQLCYTMKEGKNLSDFSTFIDFIVRGDTLEEKIQNAIDDIDFYSEVFKDYFPDIPILNVKIMDLFFYS